MSGEGRLTGRSVRRCQCDCTRRVPGSLLLTVYAPDLEDVFYKSSADDSGRISAERPWNFYSSQRQNGWPTGSRNTMKAPSSLG